MQVITKKSSSCGNKVRSGGFFSETRWPLSLDITAINLRLKPINFCGPLKWTMMLSQPFNHPDKDAITYQIKGIVTKSMKKKISKFFLPMTLWHHLTGFFTLPVYLITITCHSIYDSIHCFGIIAVQSHSLDSPDEQKKNQDKVLLQENK